MTARDSIAVGRVLRPWGRHGVVVVAPLTHDVRRFEGLRRVWLGRDAKLVEYGVGFVRLDRRSRPLLQFTGVESIDAAETLRGLDVCVPESEAMRPGEDAFFEHELIGCEVWTVAGERVGEVHEVIDTAGPSLLAIRVGDDEVLVPAVRDIVRDVQVTARRIVIAAPDGLLDLKETARFAPLDS